MYNIQDGLLADPYLELEINVDLLNCNIGNGIGNEKLNKFHEKIRKLIF